MTRISDQELAELIKNLKATQAAGGEMFHALDMAEDLQEARRELAEAKRGRMASALALAEITVLLAQSQLDTQIAIGQAREMEKELAAARALIVSTLADVKELKEGLAAMIRPPGAEAGPG